ncbi:hypothetical protein HYE82_02815 [Streptomyces sp. BR123]|uniref:hypothetical protein n=1 Tax=Streptomyces sp. BR123 TaxID=2749828 RepID=UPI0015C430DB|nr:hypothetical protein [Streptomyces sp. BR123]NXY93359.1 hypothetical protein [Streptomyces sp. BR123]
MISEPELEGGWEDDRPAPQQQGDAEGTVHRPRAPWMWALGGAVLASAVWTALPVLQDRSFGAPRVAYRHTEDLCKETRLDTLVKTTAPVMSNHRAHRESPALDWSHCEYFTEWEEKGTSYQMQIMVELHKRTDPAPEFGVAPGPFRESLSNTGEAEQVPGLGERALVNGKSPYTSGPRLQVLDGGAVFTLSVGWLGDTDETGAGGPQPDEDAVKAAMIEDMRILMARLKK